MAFEIAYVLAYRGEADRAFDWLEKASDNRDSVSAQLQSSRS